MWATLLLLVFAVGCAQAPARRVEGQQAIKVATRCAEGDQECKAREQRERDEADEARAREGATGLVQGGGTIVPCVSNPQGSVCGVTFPPPPIRRGPLHVRRLDVSLGIDRALSPSWVVGGLLGVGRGRFQRSEAALRTSGVFTSFDRETTIRTRNASVAGLITWFASPRLSVDAAISYQRTAFDFERIDFGGSERRFIGANTGRAWAASLFASTTWRWGGFALVPLLGLDHVDSRVEALIATFPDAPKPDTDTFAVSPQRAKALAAQAGLQAQWPLSRSFGVLVPYVRTALRHRLSLNSTPIVSTAPGVPTLVTELDPQTGRRGTTLAGGLQALLPGGTSVFADLSATRGSDQLREARLSLGVKFSR